jgi:hypothetical protein
MFNMLGQYTITIQYNTNVLNNLALVKSFNSIFKNIDS